MDSKHAWPLVKGACPIALSGQQTNKNTNKLIKARKRKTKNWLCCCYYQQVYNVFFSFWFLKFFCFKNKPNA